MFGVATPKPARPEPFPYGDDRFGAPLRDDLSFLVLEKDLYERGFEAERRKSASARCRLRMYVAGATLFLIVRPGRKLEPRALASNRERLYSGSRGCGIEVGVGAGRQAFIAGLAWAALAIAPAAAADMSALGIDNTMPPPAPVIAPGPTTYINFLDEARVGVYAHNWIHDEGSPVDVSGELLSNPIGYANNIGGPWFSWFFNPRINIGAMINTGGKTSYGFTGLTWRIPIYKGFFFEGEFGARGQHLAVARRADRVNTGAAGTSANRAASATSSASTGISSPISSTSAMRACAPTSTRA